MFNSAIKKAALCSLATAAMAIGTAAYAHTVVKDNGTERHGEHDTQYNAFVITHGCNNDAKTEKLLPVTAQSAVFPNGTSAQAFKIDPISFEESSINIFDEIEDTGGLGYLNLSPGIIQDRNVFKKSKEVTGVNNVVRALVWTVGKLDTTAYGLNPFAFGGINFKTDSCAKSLQVRIAIANYCSKSKNQNKNNRADIWIGHATPLFNDVDIISDGFWPTLTIKRDLDSNPLQVSCGDGYDIAIQPSDADIDAYLPIKGYWPK